MVDFLLNLLGFYLKYCKVSLVEIMYVVTWLCLNKSVLN